MDLVSQSLLGRLVVFGPAPRELVPLAAQEPGKHDGPGAANTLVLPDDSVGRLRAALKGYYTVCEITVALVVVVAC
jgi:hypothetical protein